MASAKHLDHMPAADPAPHVDRQALPRVFVDQVQHPHRPSIVSHRADEVV